MRHTKKAQLEVAFNWLVALVLIFTVFITFMVWNKPWQTFDNKISPKIDTSYEAGGKTAVDLMPQVRRNQALVPVIIIGAILAWAILSTIKPDPNYPFQ